MKKLVYLNNFPSQDAVKGQEFQGDSDLEKSLLTRGVIGDGEPTVKTVDSSETKNANKELEAKVTTLEDANKELEAKVTTLEDANKTLEEQVGFMKQIEANTKEQIEKLMEQITTLEDANKELGEGDIGQLKKEITALKGKNTKLTNELEALKAD